MIWPVKLHSQVVGAGPPLVMLHGLFGSHQNWQPIARRLSGLFRVHTVDLRNHGASPHHPEISYPAMAADLLGFLDYEAISRAHLLGHSLGGKVAMQFALLHSDRVDKLIAVDVAPRAYESVHDEILEALRELDLTSLRTRTEAEELLAGEIPNHATRRFLLTNLVRVPKGGWRWRINLEALYAHREQLTREVSGSGPVRNPALFLRGQHSDYIRETDLPDIRTLFPGAVIEMVEGAGHWIHVDRPEALLQAVIQFLTT